MTTSLPNGFGPQATPVWESPPPLSCISVFPQRDEADVSAAVLMTEGIEAVIVDDFQHSGPGLWTDHITSFSLYVREEEAQRAIEVLDLSR